MNPRLEAKLAALKRTVARKEFLAELSGAELVIASEFIDETPVADFLWGVISDASTIPDDVLSHDDHEGIASWLKRLQTLFIEAGEVWLSPLLDVGGWCKIIVDPDTPWLASVWHSSADKCFALFDPLLDRALLLYDGDADYFSKALDHPTGKRRPSKLVEE